MAENSSNGLEYLLEIEQQHLEYLGAIRHWDNLKIASDAGLYWIKGLTSKDIDSLEIKSIPFKSIFYLKENKMFPFGSNLPLKKLPSSLLWTPIGRGLPIALPQFNHNYFGIQDKLQLKLVASEKEREPFAMLTSLDNLKEFIEKTSAVRLKNLTWTIIDHKMALIIGTPILPIQGETFWVKNNFLIPTGYDFDKNLFVEIISRKMNVDGKTWVLWNKDSTYCSIANFLISDLSISSFRLSIRFQKLNQKVV